MDVALESVMVGAIDARRVSIGGSDGAWVGAASPGEAKGSGGGDEETRISGDELVPEELGTEPRDDMEAELDRRVAAAGEWVGASDDSGTSGGGGDDRCSSSEESLCCCCVDRGSAPTRIHSVEVDSMVGSAM
jgi:hypothetical protein